jgi:ATP-binding cassette subfamily B protein
MLFTPKLISDSFKAIEAFSENKDIAASVIREELIRNILLIIATTIIAGFNVLNATDSHRYVSAYRI